MIAHYGKKRHGNKNLGWLVHPYPQHKYDALSLVQTRKLGAYRFKEIPRMLYMLDVGSLLAGESCGMLN